MGRRKPTAYTWAFRSRLLDAFGDLTKHGPLSKEEFARRISAVPGYRGVTGASVGRWMHEQKPDLPGMDIVPAIAAVLEIHPGWLAWGLPPRDPPPSFTALKVENPVDPPANKRLIQMSPFERP